MEFRLENITIRTVTHDDINEAARMWNFEKGEISLNEASKAINWMSENHKLNMPHKIVHVCFAIFENDTDRIIGWCGLDGRGRHINGDNKISIFYLIDKDFRRRGYGTECARKMLDYGFAEMEIDRIDGECAKDNTGSQRILEKIGMKRIEDNRDGSMHYFISYGNYYKNI